MVRILSQDKKQQGDFDMFIRLSSLICTTPVWNSMRLFCSAAKPPVSKKPTKELADLAIHLIFGSRHYSKFTHEEKKIVNAYQEFVGKEDCIVLPNTLAEQKQKKIQELLRRANESN